MNRKDMIIHILTWEQVAAQAAEIAQEMRALLADQARAEMEQEGAAPTWRMPDLGTASLTIRKPSAQVVDEDAFVAWVGNLLPHAVQTVTQVRPAERKAILGGLDLEDGVPCWEDGEVVPGVTVKPGGPGPLTIRPSKAAVAGLADTAATVVGSLAELLATPAGADEEATA